MPSPPNSTAHSPSVPGPAKSPRKARSGLRPALSVAAKNTVRIERRRRVNGAAPSRRRPRGVRP
eukprot:scaffold139532_cov178-Phaeocystis_antarctica.AAC.1